MNERVVQTIKKVERTARFIITIHKVRRCKTFKQEAQLLATVCAGTRFIITIHKVPVYYLAVRVLSVLAKVSS